MPDAGFSHEAVFFEMASVFEVSARAAVAAAVRTAFQAHFSQNRRDAVATDCCAGFGAGR